MAMIVGKTVDGRTINCCWHVRESWGERTFAFRAENGYWNPVTVVRGDCFGDAYEWYLCSKHGERETAIAAEDMPDYLTDEAREVYDKLVDRGMGASDAWTMAAQDDSIVDYATVNDNGTWCDTETVNGVELESVNYFAGVE